MNVPKLQTSNSLKSVKKKDSVVYDYIIPWLLAIFFIFLGPACIGIFFIASANLLFRLLAVEAVWSVEIGFFLLLFSIGMIFFVTLSISQGILEITKGIDHLLRRIFSIVVIGINDRFFKGNKIIPSIILFITITILIALDYYFYLFLISIKSLQILSDAVSGHGNFQDAGFFTMGLYGLALTYSLFFISFPLTALFVPVLRKMTKRPELTLLDVVEKLPPIEVNDVVRVAHISDLHVGGHDDSMQFSSKILSIAESTDFDIIALTGDITDAGKLEEWEQFLTISALEKTNERVVLVPGNHDLNTWEKSKIWTFVTIEPHRKTESHNKAYLYLQVAVRVMGNRTWVVCPKTKKIRQLTDVYVEAKQELENWVNNKSTTISPGKFLEDLFPMIVETTADSVNTKVISVVWNTIKANRWAPLNSIGALTSAQIERANKLLASNNFRTLPLLHMMHHQLAVPNASIDSIHPSLSFFKTLYTVGMGLEAPEYFLQFVAKKPQSCVLHGHHHKYFVGEVSSCKISVVSAPSSTFGTEASYHSSVKANNDGPRWLELEFAINGNALTLVKVTPRYEPLDR